MNVRFYSIFSRDIETYFVFQPALEKIIYEYRLSDCHRERRQQAYQAQGLCAPIILTQK